MKGRNQSKRQQKHPWSRGTWPQLTPRTALGSNSVLQPCIRADWKKMFQPSHCVKFLMETLLLSKFLSNENKILMCLSTTASLGEKWRVGLHWKGKNSWTDRVLGHCKVLACRSWMRLSTFLGLFITHFRHHWCFQDVVTGIKTRKNVPSQPMILWSCQDPG